MSYIWRSRRRREQQTSASAFVVHHQGRPVAAAQDAHAARTFVYENAEMPVVTRTTSWTGTGKFLVEGLWTGWEMREVRAL